MTSTTHRLTRFLLVTSALASAYAQTPTFTSMSMASYGPYVAPDSIAAGFGMNLVAGTTAGAPPLQTSLGNVQVSITDSTGAKFDAPLYLVSPTQINYVIPAKAAVGRATIMVTSGTSTFSGTSLIANVAPGIVTASSDGRGVPAAQVVRSNAAGTQTVTNTFMAGPNSTFMPAPINLASSPSDAVYLMLYATGVRRHSLNPVIATIGAVSVPVSYAGAQAQFPGLDQINVGPLPQSLVGKGQLNLTVLVDGVPSNPVALSFQ